MYLKHIFYWLLFAGFLLPVAGQETAQQDRSNATSVERLATIVDVLKFGRPGQQFIVQGEIKAVASAQKIRIHDGTFHIDVYLNENLQRLGLRPGDFILVEGIVHSVFLQSNVLIATAIQRIDKLVSQETRIKKTVPTYPERISSDPDAVTRIRDINWYAADGQFVNVIGKVRQEIHPNTLYILQDESGEIAVELPPGYDELKLYEGDRLRIRARVELDDRTAAKKLLAVFIDSINDLPATVTPKIHIEPDEEATKPAQSSSQPKQVVVTKPVFISGPDKSDAQSTSPKRTETAATVSKPAAAKAPATSPRKSPEERLVQLKRLYERGLITEAEYQAKRAEIISQL